MAFGHWGGCAQGKHGIFICCTERNQNICGINNWRQCMKNRICATSEEDQGESKRWVFLASSTISISKNIGCVVWLSASFEVFLVETGAGCWFNLYPPTLLNQSSQFAPFQWGAMTQKQKLQMNSTHQHFKRNVQPNMTFHFLVDFVHDNPSCHQSESWIPELIMYQQGWCNIPHHKLFLWLYQIPSPTSQCHRLTGWLMETCLPTS